MTLVKINGNSVWHICEIVNHANGNKTEALHCVPHGEVGVNWSLKITMLNTFHLCLPQIADGLRSRVTLVFEI